MKYYTAYLSICFPSSCRPDNLLEIVNRVGAPNVKQTTFIGDAILSLTFESKKSRKAFCGSLKEILPAYGFGLIKPSWNSFESDRFCDIIELGGN